MGCHVEISTSPDPKIDGFDIVHLFNITRPQETYSQALNAQRAGIPVALSPIYVDYRETDRNARSYFQRLVFRGISPSTAEYVKIAARALLNGEMNNGTAAVLRTGYRKAQLKLLTMSTLLLPNSESEMQRIRRDFPESRSSSYIVVPNAVDEQLFDLNRIAPNPAYKDCVLCVGRIEPRKCQLELVKALKGTGLRLVLIGKPGPNYMKYFETIKKEADRNTEILGRVEHEELPPFYAACKVHALVSWMETTGLSSLEAGVMGANIVITDKGDTREYFEDFAYYCSPASISSIRNAVQEAYNAPRSGSLIARIHARYTWEETGRLTLSAYEQLLRDKVDSQKGNHNDASSSSLESHAQRASVAMPIVAQKNDEREDLARAKSGRRGNG